MNLYKSVANLSKSGLYFYYLFSYNELCGSGIMLKIYFDDSDEFVLSFLLRYANSISVPIGSYGMYVFCK
jgi:hypothetical protein